MTNNQIKYKEVLEKERSNRANENIKWKELDIKDRELIEAMANNLRNYKVNLDKNAITRLANDQTDERERRKIAETIRNNVAKELETNRHNLEDEAIRKQQNVINSLKNKYDAGSILAAIFGLMPEDEVKSLYGDSKLLQWSQNLVNSWTGPNPNAVIEKRNRTMNTQADRKQQYDKTLEGDNWDEYDPRNNTWRSQRVKRNGKEKTISYSEYKGNSFYDPKADENEIPSDYSNSAGPSKSEVKYSVPDANGGNTQSASQVGSNVSSDKKNVIWSPGSQVGPGWNL